MILKVLMPFQQLMEKQNVVRIVAETTIGSLGILPRRLDFVASLVPGIITYETPEEGEQYLAVEAGILVKKGLEVCVAIRNGLYGTDLGKLRSSIEKEYSKRVEGERTVTSILTKLENDVIKRLLEFHHG